MQQDAQVEAVIAEKKAAQQNSPMFKMQLFCSFIASCVIYFFYHAGSNSCGGCPAWATWYLVQAALFGTIFLVTVLAVVNAELIRSHGDRADHQLREQLYTQENRLEDAAAEHRAVEEAESDAVFKAETAFRGLSWWILAGAMCLDGAWILYGLFLDFSQKSGECQAAATSFNWCVTLLLACYLLVRGQFMSSMSPGEQGFYACMLVLLCVLVFSVVPKAGALSNILNTIISFL